MHWVLSTLPTRVMFPKSRPRKIIACEAHAHIEATRMLIKHAFLVESTWGANDYAKTSYVGDSDRFEDVFGEAALFFEELMCPGTTMIPS